MNTREIREMREYISNYNFPPQGSVIVDCFKRFANLTVKSVEDVFKINNSFANFMLSNIERFNCGSMGKEKIIERLDEFCFFLSEYLDEQRIESQKIYTNILTEILPNGKDTRILDVGAGEMAIASLLMGKHTDRQIDAIDSDRFFIDDELASRFNVRLKQKKFRPTHKTNRYDLLIGFTPCKATYTLVENAVKHNKPYFLTHCVCGIPEERRNFDIETDWYNYLKEIDPKVQVREGYIYNMDISNKQLNKLVSRYGSQSELNKKYKAAADVVDDLLEMFLMGLAGAIFGDK